MKIRLLLIAVGVLVIAAIVWFAGSRAPEVAIIAAPAPPASRPATVELPPQTPLPPPTPPQEATPPPPSATPLPPTSPMALTVSPEAQAEVEKVGLMLRDFRTLFGENPVGTNAEIMKSIMGGNAKGAKLGPPENMRVNDNGELLDQWGTPIFFHALSRTQMEIRSAGPDGIMWNGDDVLLK